MSIARKLPDHRSSMKPSCVSASLIHNPEEYDPQCVEEMERLHRLFVIGRWCIVLMLWTLIGFASIWSLRHEFVMVRHRFTWAAVRYGLAFNIWSALGLSICIGPTVALLVWQTRNILFGLPRKEAHRLKNYVLRIRGQGESHPLWKYVCDRPSAPLSFK